VKDQTKESVSRRGFFGTAGKGLAVGVGAAVTAATGAEAAVEAPEGDGYRETRHVKTYYELARS
jgi:nitrous oxide reductase